MSDPDRSRTTVIAASEAPLAAIDHLFPTTRLDGFLSAHYPNTWLAEDGPLERLGELGALEMFDDPLALIDRAVEDTVVVYVRHPSALTQQRSMDKPSAKRMYEDGMTVSIEGADLMIPAVGRWAAALRRELGYAADVRDVALLLSPPGDAVPMHFDGTEVLVVQLRGRKRWLVAENTTISCPDFSYFPGEPDGKGSRDGGGRRAFERSFDWPAAMPASASVHVMAPGSALFVPRGWWHETLAQDVTVSLTFKVGAPSAISLVLAALERRLRSDARWRSPLPVWGASAQRAQAATRMDGLMHDLSRLARPGEAPPVSSGPRAFLVAAGLRFSFDPPVSPARAFTFVAQRGSESQRIKIDLDPAELCRVLSVPDGVVNEAELRSATDESCAAGIAVFIDLLLDREILLPADGRARP